jgi:hypothetical protein
MKIGLKAMSDPKNIVPNNAQMMLRDDIYRIRDLRNEFFTDKSMSVDDAFKQFVDIIKTAAPVN